MSHLLKNKFKAARWERTFSLKYKHGLLGQQEINQPDVLN